MEHKTFKSNQTERKSSSKRNFFNYLHTSQATYLNSNNPFQCWKIFVDEIEIMKDDSSFTKKQEKMVTVTHLISSTESFCMLYRETVKLLQKFPLPFLNPSTDFTKKPLSEYSDSLSTSLFLSSEEKEPTSLSMCDFWAFRIVILIPWSIEYWKGKL